MQKVVKIIVSILLTIWISYWIIFAWEGLTASDGDSLTHTKWNDLLSIVQTNSWELSSISSDVSSINSKLSFWV